jgi:cellulose synthase/poly-beta-1,6-N-acetylglucosamine synthase-like glycosyltransferase
VADGQPRLSVLVPIWEERARIAGLVAAFHALAYQPRELVLCAGGPDGSYIEALRFRAPNVVVLEQSPGEGKQRALERCFRACHGDILFLTDADARPTAAAVAATLAPILAGEAEAATGAREPLAELRSLPIIAYQWALEIAGDAAIPDLSPGMLGSNAALTRHAAIRAGSFAWDAATGTDYSLACRLRAAGVGIRFVRSSRMPVGLATNLRAYSRQRSRWLRNLVLVGRRYRDWAAVCQGIQPMVLGALFVVLPFVPGLLRRPARIVWLTALAAGWWRRIGYIRAAPPAVGLAFPPRRWPLLLLYTLVDFSTWARAGAECAVPAWRGRW